MDKNQMRELIQNLRAIHDGDFSSIEYKGIGLCSNLLYPLYMYNPALEDFIRGVFLDWDENHTQCTEFPVMDGINTWIKESREELNHYEGAYGCARRRLAGYLAKRIEEDYL